MDPTVAPDESRPPSRQTGSNQHDSAQFSAEPPAARPPSRTATFRRKTDAYALERIGARPPSSTRRKEPEDTGDDVFGPKLQEATAAFAALAADHATSWTYLHSLLHAAQKERSELMRNVSQLEQNNDALSEELAQAREDHIENVRMLTAKAQQEMEEALEAARSEWEKQKRAELIRLRQEFDREKSQVLSPLIRRHNIALAASRRRCSQLRPVTAKHRCGRPSPSSRRIHPMPPRTQTHRAVLHSFSRQREQPAPVAC